MSTPQIISVTPTSGGPGTAVTINGTGLSSVTGMSLGGVAASIASLSDTQLAFSVPAGVAPGTLTIVLSYTGILVDTGGFAVTGSGGNGGGPGPSPPGNNEGLIIGALAAAAAIVGILVFGRKKE